VAGDIGAVIRDRLVGALRAALDIEVTPAETMLRPSTRPGVDYQCNIAMSLAKQVGKAPRAVAEAIVAALDSADLFETPRWGVPASSTSCCGPSG
jgi:arginyl-tRNA synthetase